MSTLNPVHGGVLPATERQPLDYIQNGRGILSWITTLDHKRISLLYMWGIMAFFLIGGMAALLVRTSLLIPQKNVEGGTPFPISHDLYNLLFTVHGAIMVFIVIIPGIPAALGNFFLPLMLGAKDVAFPRINLMSWWFWAVGAFFLVLSLLFGGVDTGWTFYTPYSTNYAMSGTVYALTGAFILGFSSIFTGLNFIVTIHKLRPPEMGWFGMPLVLWGIYSTAIMQVLATPVLGITLLLLAVERVMRVGIFNPALGGDPVLMQHFFWFYSHPAVYIMIVPAMGVMSELIAVHSRKHIFGYKFIAFSSVAIAIISFLVWGHHMFTSGQSDLASTIFSAITYTVAIPSAIKMFNWVATLYQGSISFTAPMVYALGFVVIFGIGGVTGLFLATIAVDVHLHDTYFVVAHFHMVMAGTIFVFFGGLFHWWPKMTGRMYNENLARLAAIIAMTGFTLTFLAQFPMGSQGMTRRYYNYDAFFYNYHLLSTIGAYVAGVGFVMAVFSLVQSWFAGKRAPQNPWGANSLEWHAPTPPPTENFLTPPPVEDPYDYHLWQYDARVGGYVRREEPATVSSGRGH